MDFWQNSVNNLSDCIDGYLTTVNNTQKQELISSIRFKNGKIDNECKFAQLLDEYAEANPITTTSLNWKQFRDMPQETFECVIKLYLRQVLSE